MTTALYVTLFLFALLQVKHLFADYFLQTSRMLMNRAVYWHLGRAQHAGLHAVFSACIFLLLGAPVVFTLGLCAVEWVVHYHIDWAKAVHSEKAQYGPEDAAYWRAFGVDQLMHQFTYIAMIWAWAAFTL